MGLHHRRKRSGMHRRRLDDGTSRVGNFRPFFGPKTYQTIWKMMFLKCPDMPIFWKMRPMGLEENYFLTFDLVDVYGTFHLNRHSNHHTVRRLISRVVVYQIRSSLRWYLGSRYPGSWLGCWGKTTCLKIHGIKLWWGVSLKWWVGIPKQLLGCSY